MKFFSKLLCLGITILLSTAHAFASSTFLGPTIKTKLTVPNTEFSAASILGELGPRNYRLNGTYGVKLPCNQRLKITGDFLWQKIKYPFFIDQNDQFGFQRAIGLGYQYSFAFVPYKPQFNLNLYYAHSSEQELDSKLTTFF